ncbi:hypothetical protein [Dyella japonica]|uniref:Uncharacterized protein n=1 Tax=Dyella japonica TaxID=231455 RepID=A0ABV2K3X6_9GAMM
MNALSVPSEQPDLSWQLKLLPFITRSIAVMGFLFFVSSFLQLHLMYLELKVDPIVGPSMIAASEKASSTASADALHWDGLLALEHETLIDRTKSLNAVILRQASLLHLGFLTGMVLCLVGAIFVLGQLRTPESTLSGEGHGIKLALNTSSPGIVLAALGCGLMCLTLFHRYQFNLPDKTVYLPPAQFSILSPPGATTLSPGSTSRVPAVPATTSTSGTPRIPATDDIP